MKTISIRQPWASLIIQGYKPVENRTWKSRYRGPLLIHAGKAFDNAGASWVLKNFPHLRERVLDSTDLKGGIIGSVTMVNCVTEHESPWFCGPYGFVFTNPKPMGFVPCPGRLSFFEVPEVTI